MLLEQSRYAQLHMHGAPLSMKSGCVLGSCSSCLILQLVVQEVFLDVVAEVLVALQLTMQDAESGLKMFVEDIAQVVNSTCTSETSGLHDTNLR